MLTRRIFRQLTDGLLLHHQPSISSPSLTTSSSTATARGLVIRCTPHCFSSKKVGGGLQQQQQWQQQYRHHSHDSLCYSSTLNSTFTPPSASAPRQQKQYQHQQIRRASSSSSSSTRWKARQGKDRFGKEAKVKGYMSRAAFKLLELDEKHHLFKPGSTVVDLGYAPGAWSQVAVSRTNPDGRVVGIDIIPAQPPAGVSTIQGNFLSPDVRAQVTNFIRDPTRGRPRVRTLIERDPDSEEGVSESEFEEMERGYIDFERRSSQSSSSSSSSPISSSSSTSFNGLEAAQEVVPAATRKMSLLDRDDQAGRVVDVVLSDMSAPWDQTDGFHKNSLSDPYFRMMNTSGLAVRDHGGSMDLCHAALLFAFDTLRTGGHFVCKFYQGSEEKILEGRLRKLFSKVYREKPEASRSESKEAYLVALRRLETPTKHDIFQD